MKQGYFITGTDTGVGKTLVSAAVIIALRNQGLRVSGMKPVASGCVNNGSGFRNEDADRLLNASTADADYDIICPYRFSEPVAPHIAAKKAGINISIDHIAQCYSQLNSSSDAVVVEGTGGWQVPINEEQYMSDVAIELALPVVIVVGGRLGCINHALLTAEGVIASGLSVAGWIFNQIDPGLQQASEVKSTLQSHMPGLLLADIPWQEKPDATAISREFVFFDVNSNRKP
ncbi:MAG: ATP-dependent dethiobiotin synthetase BioD [bacterium]|nr:MAG: ATP-dependent dethiobiotin synthetase BioD [bacterium]